MPNCCRWISPDPEISLHEGYTPLIRLYQYERIYNHPHLYIKDERQGPTSSFKDRQAALTVMALKRAGIAKSHWLRPATPPPLMPLTAPAPGSSCGCS